MTNLITYSKKLILEQSEELLIVEAKRNPRKFEPIYNRYFEKIFKAILNRVGDKQTAADLTANVFLKAINKIKNYDYKGFSIYSWLFRIALNECNEHFRKTGKTIFVVIEPEHLTNLTEEISIYDQEEIARLYKALSLLKSADLELIRLRFFEGLPFSDIGQVLNINEGNCKVRLYRALEKLKSIMIKK